MKKLTIALALILCLVVAVFAFASCDKKKAASTTAAKTGATECAHTWGDFVIDLEPTCSDAGIKSKYCTKCGAQDPASITEIDTIDHTPGADFIIDTKPNCSNFGYKSKHCTVCGAIIDSTVERIDKDPDVHDLGEWTITKTATLFEDGNRNATCKLCGTNIPETYSSIVEQKYTTEKLSKRLFVEQNIYTELLKEGEKHFYPDASNGGTGLDLYVEYSLLWNDTFKNLGDNKSSGGHPIVDTRLCTASGDNGKGNDLTWMSLKSNASGSSCTYAGGFEYGSLRTVESGPHGMSTTKANNDDASGTTYADYPNIGGDVEASPEWGWHRVGVKFHQEVSNAAELIADTTGEVKATYYMYVETYIDGVLVSRLSNAATDEFGASTEINENLLFTAKPNGEGGIVYEDGDHGNYINGMRFPFDRTTKDAAYVVYADYYATAGTGFVQSVTRVDTPSAATYTAADGAEIPAAIYYTLNP